MIDDVSGSKKGKILGILCAMLLQFLLCQGAPADDFIRLESYNYRDHYIRQRDHLGELTVIKSDNDKTDSDFKIVKGLSGGNSVSFESRGFPGNYLRHQDSRIKLHRPDGTDLFRKDASFKMVPGLADASWNSFESVNYPGYYIRHSNYHLFIQNGKEDVFRKDATFRVVRSEPPKAGETTSFFDGKYQLELKCTSGCQGMKNFALYIRSLAEPNQDNEKVTGWGLTGHGNEIGRNTCLVGGIRDNDNLHIAIRSCWEHYVVVLDGAISADKSLIGKAYAYVPGDNTCKLFPPFEPDAVPHETFTWSAKRVGPYISPMTSLQKLYPSWFIGDPDSDNQILMQSFPKCSNCPGLIVEIPTRRNDPCSVYAREAVESNEENIRRGCGYSGLRWSSDYAGHFKWCMGVDKTAAQTESRARAEALQRCTGMTGKGASCDAYAKAAVQNNEENIRRGCGYLGLRWSSDYTGHFNWCMGVDDATAQRESRAREEDLRKCPRR